VPQAPIAPVDQPVPYEVELAPVQACDLDLLLAGVTGGCPVLGAGVHQGQLSAPLDGRPPSGDAVVHVHAALPATPTAAAEALRAGSVLLRDAEHTPVATLTHLRRTEDGLAGRVKPGRPRESGTLTDLRVDLTDPGNQGRAVLLLGRAPVTEDDEDLQRWAAAAGDRPLVLVSEGGVAPRHLPARVARDLAQELLARLGLSAAEIRVVPMMMRDPETDSRLAGLVTSRLAASPALHLTEGGDGAASAVWARVCTDLFAGGDVRGVEPQVERRLRRWRPRRDERGLVVLMTGLSGSGKSTLARDLDTYLLLRSQRSTTLLDGDVVRRLLSAGLGFDRASRELNVRRIGWVAARVAEHGGTAICSPIAPFAAVRREVHDMVESVADLVLVHVSTPLAECERRDLKGLYARARRGEIPDFTGISSPYEVPEDADVVVDTSVLDREAALALVVGHLVAGGWLPQSER